MTTTTQSNEKDVPAVPLPISLRDWFAGQCIVGFEPMCEDDAKVLARSAYWMADAMLTARDAQ